MRLALAAAALAALAGGCASRARPYRFGSPMLGMAEVPVEPLRADPAPPARRPALANREAAPIRVVSAPRIREASAAAAAEIAAVPAAAPAARAALPAPHLLPPGAPVPAIHAPVDLRALVGFRDKRDPIAVALGWAHDLGGNTDGDVAALSERFAAPTEVALPGDLLIFDHAVGDDESDLVAVVIARDPRGVTEYAYLGGGVVRRGFVDPAQPAKRRDADGLVVNTYLRNGKRWPAKGTHYLAGELLGHVVHTH